MIVLNKPVLLDKLIRDPKTGNVKNMGQSTIDYIDIIYHDYPTSKQYFCNIQNLPGIIMLFENEEYIENMPITSNLGKQKLLNMMGTDQEKWLQNRMPKIKTDTLEDHPYGPGTMLHNMLKKVGIKTTPDCSCLKKAIEMNKNGYAWCENNIETILKWLKEESQKRKLPFVEFAAKLLVQRAIKKSKKHYET